MTAQLVDLFPRSTPRVWDTYEAVIEVIEAQPGEFTRDQIKRQVSGIPHSRRVYCRVELVLQTLIMHRLVRQVTPRGGERPARFAVAS